METLTIAISVFSTVVAVFAVWISTRTLNEQKRIAKISNNYSLLSQASSLILDHPSLLELHNISEDDLAQVGVTEKEVVYIMQSIIAGQLYYEIEDSKRIDYNSFSDYRRNILINSKVRVVWTKFMREKLVVVSPFVLAVDEFYKNQPTLEQ